MAYLPSMPFNTEIMIAHSVSPQVSSEESLNTVTSNHTIHCARYNKGKEMTSSTLARNEFSAQALKHSISPHENHGSFKRTCDEEKRYSLSPTHIPSPAIKEEYDHPLPSVETYDPEHIRFGLDPDRTPRRFDFRAPFPPHHSPPPPGDDKRQDYGTRRSGGCMSDCAIVEFRVKSDHELMFKGPDTAMTTFLKALPEITTLLSQYD